MQFLNMFFFDIYPYIAGAVFLRVEFYSKKGDEKGAHQGRLICKSNILIISHS